MSKSKNWVTGALLVIAVGVGGWLIWRYLQPKSLPEGFASGNGRVEGTEVAVAAKFAGRIAERSPIALRTAKEAVKSAARMNLREGLEREMDLFCLAFGSEDKTEGVRAFLEKRKPDFKGR